MYDIVKIFIDYAPLTVIIKYWLYSLCCTIYPYSLFLAYIVFCTSYKIIHFKVNTSVVFHNLVPRGVHHPKWETLYPFGSHPPDPPFPQPWSTTNLCFVPANFPTLDVPYKRGRSVWSLLRLTSFAQHCVSKGPCVVASISASPCFWLSNLPLGGHTVLFVHSSVGGHVGSSQLWPLGVSCQEHGCRSAPL